MKKCNADRRKPKRHFNREIILRVVSLRYGQHSGGSGKKVGCHSKGFLAMAMPLQGSYSNTSEQTTDGMGGFTCGSGSRNLEFDNGYYRCANYSGYSRLIEASFASIGEGILHFLDNHWKGLFFSAGDYYMENHGSYYRWMERQSDDGGQDREIKIYNSISECVWDIYDRYIMEGQPAPVFVNSPGS